MPFLQSSLESSARFPQLTSGWLVSIECGEDVLPGPKPQGARKGPELGASVGHSKSRRWYLIWPTNKK